MLLLLMLSLLPSSSYIGVVVVLLHLSLSLSSLIVVVVTGERLLNIDSGRDADIHAPPSQHFTVVFNSFVMMTLFNEINARKIHGQRNVFEGLFTNYIFLGIWVTTFVAQILLIEFGSYAFSTAGLTFDQWVWCLFFGVSTLLWGQVSSHTKCCLNVKLTY